ncbi:hypothetical protein Bca52824_066442 [Brassica carinata]|uniref:Uncharacterized protein n=1 Tax=Brassica carinata TaxID=52824 RepID=A0A8X7QLW0_BRACI|nr:hypothetical protein Bca52824_066442 [Brassica carinata]
MLRPLQPDTRRRSLKLNLRGGGCLTLTFLKVPSEQGAARIGKVILESAILTTVVVLSLTVYTFWAAKRGYDFNFLGPFLFGALIVLIVFAMIQVMPLIPNSMP